MAIYRFSCFRGVNFRENGKISLAKISTVKVAGPIIKSNAKLQIELLKQTRNMDKNFKKHTCSSLDKGSWG